MHLIRHMWNYVLNLVIALIFSLSPPMLSSAKETDYLLLNIKGQPMRWQSQDEFGITILRYAIAKEEVVLRVNKDEGRTIFANQSCKVTNAPKDILRNSKLSNHDLRVSLKSALNVWESATSLFFIEIDDIKQADLVIGEGVAGPLHASAGVEVIPKGQEEFAEIKKGIICLDPSEFFAVNGTETKLNLTRVLAHEIGHILGLDHPKTSKTRESKENILMDYKFIPPGPVRLSQLDIEGIQALYGKHIYVK